VRTLNLANTSVGTAALAPNLVLGGTTTGAFAGNGAGLTNIPGSSITGPLPEGLCCHIIENRTSDPPNPENGRFWLRIDLP
jgi:hypothetical protein